MNTLQKRWAAFWIGFALQGAGFLTLVLAVAWMLAGGAG